MRPNILVVFYIIYLIELSITQYVLYNKKTVKVNPCDTSNNALVEQFFNVIFTEFLNTPPVCVCVQMCLERPTYCYPNGCLRSTIIRKPEETTTTTAFPVNRIYYNGRSPTKSVMFLVDNDKELIDDIFEGPPSLNSYSAKKETSYSNELISSMNPFKELVFKYRKLPKLEMRYNLREKMKNVKSGNIKRDKLDVLKTKWPINKNVHYGKQLINRISHFRKNDETLGTFSISVSPEKETNLKLFKKSLTKRENSNDANMDFLYPYKTTNFTIETLIDHLVSSSLSDNENKTKPCSEETNEPATIKTITNQTKPDTIRHDIISNSNTTNEAINIILINSTNADVDINKYLPDSNVTNRNIYLEMITNMSKEIEKNNNASIDFVKRIIGPQKSNFIKNSSVDVTELSYDKNNTINQMLSTLKISPSLIVKTNNTVHNKLLHIFSDTTTTKRRKASVIKSPNKNKTKQRTARQRNGKLN